MINSPIPVLDPLIPVINLPLLIIITPIPIVNNLPVTAVYPLVPGVYPLGL